MIMYEKFAIYGFELYVPSDWSIGFDRKMNRQKGVVTFSGERGDSLVVHWGPALGAIKKFLSLKEQRDFSINQLRSGSNVIDAEILEDREELYPQRVDIITKVKVTLKEGKWTRGSLVRYVFSEHIRCERSGRYYVVYAHSERTDSFSDLGQIFDHVTKSFNTCTTNSAD